MHVRCPHCRNPIEVVDEISSAEIVCTSCGSSFNLAPQASTLVLSKQLLDHFELLEELGAGAFGTVWKARDRELDRLVAIKVPRQQQLSVDEAEMFLREARSAAQLKHPNIVAVHEVGRAGDTLYIVSDFVAGVTLADWLTVHRPGPREAAELCVQIADALDHAHQQGVIHRDLKPSNIMLSEAGGISQSTRGDASSSSLRPPASSLSPHLMDFGLAKREAGEITMTVDGRTLGTPAYMSPEQAKGEAHHVDRRADIYSLGVILFELLTGELPFRGNSRMLLHQVIHDEPPSPRKLNGAVPRDLETITLKCLEKDRSRRFVSARELAEELQRFLSGRPIQSRPASRFERAWRWTRRHPARAGAAAASVIALAALAAVLVGAAYQGELKSANEELDGANARLRSANDELQSAKAQLETANLGLEELLAKQKETTGQLARANEDLKKAREDLTRLTYYRLVSLALAEWKETGASRAARLLGECRPDLRGWEWYYVDGLCRGSLAGHRKTVKSVCFSTDGQRVMAAALDGKFIVWEVDSGKTLLTSNSASDSRLATSCTLSPDGKRIAFGSLDKSINVSHVGEGEDAAPLHFANSVHVATCLAFSADGAMLVSGGQEGAIKVWDTVGGQELHSLSGHQGGVRCLAFRSDGKRVVSSGADALLKIWTLGKAEPLEFRLNAECVAFSPDGSLIACGGPDRSIRVLEVASGKELHLLVGHTRVVTSLAFSPDGKRLVSGGYDRWLKLWSIDSGEELLTLQGSAATVLGLAFSPDGSLIVSGCADGSVRLWTAGSGADALTLTPNQPSNQQVCAEFSPDSQRIVCVDDAVGIRVKSAASGREMLTLAGDVRPVNSLAYSWDGKRIAAGSKGHLHVWDAMTGEKLASWRGTGGDITSLAFVPRTQVILSGTFDGALCYWSPKGKLDCRLAGHQGPLRRILVSKDGQRLVTLSNDGLARHWDGPARKELTSPLGHAAPNACAVLLPNSGLHILSPDSDGNYLAVSMWRASDGAKLLVLHGHLAAVTAVEISPDGRRIISGDREGTLKIWDAGSGKEALSLRGHESMVTLLRFSPDGKRILSGGLDGVVKVWSASDGWDYVAQTRAASRATNPAAAQASSKTASPLPAK